MNWNRTLIIPVVLIIALFSFFAKFNSQRQDILVVHSYFTDYSWTNDVTEGMNQVFGGKTNFKVYFHHMDTKRHPTDDFRRKAGAMTRKMIDAMQPKVIICIDDDAQKYVGTYYKNDPNISVVYGGVNAKEGSYGYDATAKNVTGIYERLPLQGLTETITMIAHTQGKTGTLKIAHISDESSTVKADDAHFHAFKGWGNLKLERSRLVSTFSDWKKEILAANKELDFIIISNYRAISRHEDNPTILVPPAEVMAWTMANAKIPVIGVNGFVVEDGGAIAVAASPYEQGETTARMALDIIKGKSASELPYQLTEQFVVGMNEKALEKGNIEVQQIYTAFSKIAKRYYE
jgi:ABC-type uncharacterized transport system substrate-binding protein